MSFHTKRTNMLNTSNFQIPGKESLSKLWAHDIIYVDQTSINSLDISDSMKSFLHEDQPQKHEVLPVYCNEALVIGNHKGQIRFPTSDVTTRPNPPTDWGWDEGRRIQIEGRCVEEGESEYNRVEGHDFTGWCKKCIDTGHWAIMFPETGNGINGAQSGEAVDPQLICCRPCSDCARENKYTWGEFKPPEIEGDIELSIDDLGQQQVIDKRPWFPIPNNGTHRGAGYPANEPMTIEINNHELIRITLKDLWNHHPDHDPPSWGDFFEGVPERIIEIIFEIFGFRGELNTIATQSIDPFAQESIDRVYQRLYQCDPEFPEPNPRYPWDHTDEDWARTLDPYYEDDEEDISTIDLTIDYSSLPTPEGREDTPEEQLRKKNTSDVLDILEGVMEQEGQTLDQGKYLELCKLLRDIHKR